MKQNDKCIHQLRNANTKEDRTEGSRVIDVQRRLDPLTLTCVKVLASVLKIIYVEHKEEDG